VNVQRLAVILCACAAPLFAALPAYATPSFGVAEDLTKYAEDGGAALYPRIRSLGMVENRFTVRWNPADPTTIQERGFLDRSLPAAARAGVRVVFDVYSADILAFSIDPATRSSLFAAYLQTLARTYPQVRDYIVGNEPNESYFWQPQFGPAGEQVSAAAYLRLITASYDALKAVDPAIRVIAAGPSNEGNDRTSTSPVRYLRALGDAYRASGRAAPVMDALSFHIYPRTNTDPPSRQYAWPNTGGADLARMKQAVWDAFGGTAQPTFPEGPAVAGNGALGLVVDEFGWQVAIEPALAGRYTGVENVPTVSEAEQAAHYSELIRMLSCDTAVTDAMVFHLVDETDLNRFQTGLLRADRSERASYGAVREAIAGASSCGAPTPWTHTNGVVGAKALFAERNHPATRAIFGISATAEEDADARAGIFRVRGPKAKPKPGEIDRSLAAAASSVPALSATKPVKAGYTPRFEFRGRLKPGYYVFAIRLSATMNAGRSQTLVSRVFQVGKPRT
jgi:hypothetical protein